SLYDPAVYRDVLARIERLRPDARPQWGRMNAAQMLAHCAEIVEVYNGKPLGTMPWYVRLGAGLVRRMVMSRLPYPKGLRTHPQFMPPATSDFEAEKARLLEALETFMSLKEIPCQHPLFGELGEEEKGWSMYKHLDHHLTQFGV
ncbi:MAG: DUF1569 domain-containing protein, partial [Bacteroidetes bacterium]